MRENEEKINSFFSKYSKITFTKGKKILRPSTEMVEVYYIVKGNVRQYYINKEGDEITVHIFVPGAYFPMMILLSKSENLYYFETITNVEVYKAPFDEVLAFIKKDKDLLLDLATRFSEGLSKILHKFENSYYKDAYSKVISIIVYLVEKFPAATEDGTVTSLNFTHSDIASWIGISRETVSRQIEKLSKKKLIKYEKHRITVKDLDLLKKELNQ